MPRYDSSVNPRSLVLHPNPILRTKATPVAEIDQSVRDLALEMLRLMEAHSGYGLAAPQAGASVRLFVTQGVGEEDPPIVYINPRIVSVDGPLEGDEEGCLSLPGIRGVVRRQPHVVVEATSLDGKSFRMESQEIMGRCWQHEIDHLDGVLIIDRMTPIDRLVNRRKLRALEASGSAD